MASKTVPLIKPVRLSDDLPWTTEIELREPTGGEFLDIGEPNIWSRTLDGTTFVVEDKAVVRAYLARCVKHESGAHILETMGVADLRAVKEALFSFFDGGPTTSET